MLDVPELGEPNADAAAVDEVEALEVPDPDADAVGGVDLLLLHDATSASTAVLATPKATRRVGFLPDDIIRSSTPVLDSSTTVWSPSRQLVDLRQISRRFITFVGIIHINFDATRRCQVRVQFVTAR